MPSKKSQSQVIGSVLLILIVVGLIVIVSGFAMSFIKNKLSDSSCVDIVGKVEFTNNVKYTCYDGDTDVMSAQVHVGDIEEEIQGFTISVVSDSSESFEIKNDTLAADINEGRAIMFKPLLAPFVGKLLIPGKNSEKTYNITGITKKPDSLAIYPILKDGKTCDSSDTLKIITACS